MRVEYHSDDGTLLAASDVPESQWIPAPHDFVVVTHPNGQRIQRHVRYRRFDGSTVVLVLAITDAECCQVEEEAS